MTAYHKNLVRLVVTGSAAAVLGLAGSGVAMAAAGQELPTYPYPDCIETGECVPAGVPGVEPDGDSVPSVPGVLGVPAQR